MKIDRANARAKGLTDYEIDFVASYLNKHRMNNRAALVMLKKKPLWVCQSVAEALDKVRPGCWLRQLSEQCLTTQTAEFQLPIYKRGDDLAEHLRVEKDATQGLLAYAERLKVATRMVRALAKDAKWLKIEQADTHLILVSGPGMLIQSLIQKGLLASEATTEDEDEGIDKQNPDDLRQRNPMGHKKECAG